MKSAPLRHRLEYGIYLGFKALLRIFPHSMVRNVGRRLGDLAYFLDRRHRDVAKKNMQLALPELLLAEHQRLVKKCFQHFGATLCDAISAQRFDLVELCERLTLEGWEYLEAGESHEKGIFVLSAHLGNWEIAAHTIGAYRGTLHVIGRPADNPYLDHELQHLRQKFGNVNINKRGAAREMIKIIQQQGRVGILLDQRVQAREGIQVNFFGQPVLASPILARLSLRTGAWVVPIFGYPEPQGKYRVVFRPPIAPEGEGEEAVFCLTQKYMDVIEAEIRLQPELWLWMHRRWG